MKRFKKIMKWTGIMLLLLVSAITVTVMARQNMKYDAPYPGIRASMDSTVILRGKNLVFGAAHCADCHSQLNADSLLALGQEVPLEGGKVFRLPLGDIYAKNITPDSATGIGSYTDAEIARALRYGVHPDGTVVYDFMPFHNMSDEDLTAVVSYLRSSKPVRKTIPGHSLNILGKMVKAFMIKPVGPDGEVPRSVKPDTTASYGKYLALNVANCSGCHTKRDLTGKYTGALLAGGSEIDGFLTPNLTTDSTSRIFNWTEKQFIARFRMGRLVSKSPMPWNSYTRMTDDELKAIYRFLKTVKPAREETN